VVGDGHVDQLGPRAPPNADLLAHHFRLTPLALVLVEARVVLVEALDEQVLDVGHNVREAPGGMAGLGEHGVGAVGKGGATHPILVAGEVDLVPEAGDRGAEVGVAGE
jgi:hypothetical protein